MRVREKQYRRTLGVGGCGATNEVMRNRGLVRGLQRGMGKYRYGESGDCAHILGNNRQLNEMGI